MKLFWTLMHPIVVFLAKFWSAISHVFLLSGSNASKFPFEPCPPTIVKGLQVILDRDNPSLLSHRGHLLLPAGRCMKEDGNGVEGGQCLPCFEFAHKLRVLHSKMYGWDMRHVHCLKLCYLLLSLGGNPWFWTKH